MPHNPRPVTPLTSIRIRESLSLPTDDEIHGAECNVFDHLAPMVRDASTKSPDREWAEAEASCELSYGGWTERAGAVEGPHEEEASRFQALRASRDDGFRPFEQVKGREAEDSVEGIGFRQRERCIAANEDETLVGAPPPRLPQHGRRLIKGEHRGVLIDPPATCTRRTGTEIRDGQAFSRTEMACDECVLHRVRQRRDGPHEQWSPYAFIDMADRWRPQEPECKGVRDNTSPVVDAQDRAVGIDAKAAVAAREAIAAFD